MKSTIVAVGTEILFGQIANTNAAFLSKNLNDLGIDVIYHYTVGDNPKRVAKTVTEALKESDIVITTGGLGPTQDDLTKEVIAEAIGKKLVQNDEAFERMQKRFLAQGREMTENNIKQAFLPEGCIAMQNDYGTAPGFISEVDNKIVIALPGPPFEMKPMYEAYVRDFLSAKSEDAICYKFVKTLGIGESTLETEIIDLIDKQTDPTIATYAKAGEVTIRITSKRKTFAEAEQAVDACIEEIKKRVGKYMCAVGDKNTEEELVNKLKERGLTLSSAESCTGGMFADTIVSVAGSSAIFDRGLVTYSNQAKIDELGVKLDTLKKYGAVSEEVAKEMAQGLHKASGSDICVAVTGLAGPDGGTLEKPVGLVYTAILCKDKLICKENRFAYADRDTLRHRSVNAMIKMVYDVLGDK